VKPARVAIVGAGLTGCTLAWRLAQAGIGSVLFERARQPGGLIRSDHLHGVLYEPRGSHIFHTEDVEVWSLATSLTPFRPYRHRVDIVIEGQLLNWPIRLDDIDAQSRSGEIHRQLAERRDVDSAGRALSANFEDWCLELMGPILYERYVRPYTEKQWGRPARTLPAHWAPSRVSVRWDNDPYLFDDPFQGWPGGPNGYTDLIDGLIASELIELRTGVEVTLGDLGGWRERASAGPVVLTCPLDVFSGECFGALGWRGVAVESVHLPHLDYAQSAMVVNYPAASYPFIRIHETKHASGQQCEGTVLGFEFTGAPSRDYPIELPENRALNERYKAHVREQLGAERVSFAGRLANYVYVDMDDCMRQALDEGARLVEQLR
jgi:UDP-galactopyranose mutase